MYKECAEFVAQNIDCFFPSILQLHWYCNIHHVYLIRLTSPLRKNVTSDVVINHKVKVCPCQCIDGT